MAYKQPYGNTNKNDGASYLPIAEIATLVGKGIGAVKTGIASAKAAKAGLTIAKAAKATKAGATAAKASKGGSTLTKMVPKGAKAIDTSSAMPKLQTLQKTADAGKKGSKAFKKIGDAGKKALDKGKEVFEKGKEVVDKGRDAYDKGVEKVADVTGFDQDAIKETASNLKDSARDSIDQGLSKRKEDIEAASQKGSIDPLPSSRAVHDAEGSYANPSTTGASMCNHGPSKPNVNTTNMNTNNPAKANNNQWSSLNNNFFKATDQTFASYSAPVTIKGISFDAADAVRLGIMGYKAVNKGVKDRKNIIADKGFQKAKHNLESYKQGNLSKPDKFSDFTNEKDNIKARRKNIKSIKKKIKNKK